MQSASDNPGSLAVLDPATDHLRMQRLARHLVGDAHLADDVVQDAWLAALSKDELPGGRRWMKGAVRTLARRALSHRHHREEREERAAREDRTEPTDAIVSRLERQRRLTDAVLALREPYREMLLLRFFSGLEQREISARLDVPAATVNVRITRGLAMLRERLDREFGDRRSATAFLAAFLQPTSLKEGSTLVLGAMSMSAKILTVCVLVSLGLFATRAIATGPELAPSPAPIPVTGPPPLRATAAVPPVSIVAIPFEPPQKRPGSIRAAAVIRVLRADGKPATNARVHVVGFPSEPEAMWKLHYSRRQLCFLDHVNRGRVYEANEDGVVHVPSAPRHATIYATLEDQEGLAMLLPDSPSSEVTLRPRKRQRVRVIDAEGQPRPNTLVEVVQPASESVPQEVPILTGRTGPDGVAELPVFDEFFGDRFEVVAVRVHEVTGSRDTFRIPRPHPSPTITLTCPKVKSLTVRVVAADGTSLPAAVPVALAPGGADPTDVLLVGETRKGRVTFEDVAVGGTFHLSFGLRWSAALDHRKITLDDALHEEITVTLDGQIVELVGRVVDETGKPYTDSAVFATVPDAYEVWNRPGPTDARGRFALPRAVYASRPLPRVLRFMAGDLTGESIAVTIPQTSADRIELGDVVIPRSRPAITGQVLLPNGAPAVGFDVTCWTYNEALDEWIPSDHALARTDETGSFALYGNGFGADDALRVLSKDGFTHAPERLEGRREVTLNLTLGGIVSGSALLADGCNVAALDVIAWDLRNGPRPSPLASARWITTTLDPSGQFRFEGLAPGRYTFGLGVRNLREQGMTWIDDVSIVRGAQAPGGLQGLDLTGFRSFRLFPHLPDQKAVPGTVWAVYRDGHVDHLGNTEQLVVARDAGSVETLVLLGDGFAPTLVPPTPGTFSIEVAPGVLAVVQHDPALLVDLPEDASLRLTLTPSEPQPGGVGKLLRERTGGARLDTLGRATVRLATPGHHAARWDLVQERDGYRMVQRLDVPKTEVIVPAGGGSVPISLPASALATAWTKLSDRLR